MEALINLMKIIPKNLISLLTGSISRMELPDKFQDFLNESFVKLFKIDMSEATKALKEYDNIEDIFTRHINLDLRPIESEVVSPSDGTLCISLPTRKDRAIQAKGIEYSTEELVFGVQGCGEKEFDPAWFTTVYLAPHNYHRVHSPISGILRSVRYIPGEMWPVNMPFVKNLPNLFTRNERLVFEIEHSTGGRVYVVMVGALNVGRMQTHFVPELTTNNLNRQFGAMPKLYEYEDVRHIKAGDELGVFMLGSTAICVFDRKVSESLNLETVEFTSRKISLGQSLLVYK